MEFPLQKGDCDVAGIAKCVICILIRAFCLHYDNRQHAENAIKSAEADRNGKYALPGE